MVLGQADRFSFTNTAEPSDDARQLFERLVRRLHFVSSLLSRTAQFGTISGTFQISFEKNEMCISPVSKLNGDCKEVKARLTRKVFGQDMFSQGPNCAPRLLYVHYAERTKAMIQFFETLKRQLEKFQKNSETTDAKREIMAEVQQSMAKEGDQVQSRLESILGENGPLRPTAYETRTYDPLTKE